MLTIVRPLLGVSRSEIEPYLRGLGQGWREDASNRDLKHARNRIRHVLLPLLEREFNPSIRHVLGDLAELARGEEEFWCGEVQRACSAVVVPRNTISAGGPSLATEPSTREDEVRLSIDALARLPVALQRRVVRKAAESLGLHLDFEHVEQVLALTREQRGMIELPDNWVAEHKLHRASWPGGAPPRELVLRTRLSRKTTQYHHVLGVPGKVPVPEIGIQIEAIIIPLNGGGESSYNRDELLDPEFLATELLVRNWRPGDRFRAAHTKSDRKVKELLQARHISGPERALWPVVVNAAGDVLWMRGFGAAERFSARQQAGHGVLIRELCSAPPRDSSPSLQLKARPFISYDSFQNGKANLRMGKGKTY